MVYNDNLTAAIVASLNPVITTTEGGVIGERRAAHEIKKRLVDGSSSGQGTGFFSSTFTATVGGITISLADSADPLAAAGDDTPTSDPEGLKLRALLVENLDATNFITVKSTTSTGETSMLTGTTDSIKITAGGFNLWFSPAGVSAMNDGVDDELDIQADTGSCSVKISYIFG